MILMDLIDHPNNNGDVRRISIVSSISSNTNNSYRINIFFAIELYFRMYSLNYDQ